MLKNYYQEQQGENNGGGSAQPASSVSADTPAAMPLMTMEDLQKELSQPRQQATDTAIPEGAAPVAEKQEPTFVDKVQDVFQFAPPPKLDEPALAQPIFPDAETAEEIPGATAVENAHALASGKAEKKLQIFLKLRDKAQSRAFAAFADADRELFAMDAEDYELLKDAYLPIMEEHGGKIPWWLDIALVETIVLGSKFQMARKLQKVNAENTRLKADNTTLQKAVANAIPLSKKDRSRFDIDENGFYTRAVGSGAYLKVAKRSEKASLSDIEKIVEVNDAATVKAAFNFSDDDIAKLYPHE